MEVGEIRELVRRPSRRGARMVGMVGVALAIVGGIAWSVRQDRLTHEALDRAVAAEKATADMRSEIDRARDQLRGRAPRDPSLRRTRHEDPDQVRHVDRLYREIEDLTRFRDQVDRALGDDHRASAPRPRPSEPGKHPEGGRP